MKRAATCIGIMVGNRRQRTRVLRTYQKLAPKHIKLFTFVPSSIQWNRRRIRGLHEANGQIQKAWFAFPSAVYNRCYGVDVKLVRRMERAIGTGRCFNHVTHFDKQETYDVLSQTELLQHLPETTPLSEETLTHLLTKHKVIYIKPVLGNRGRGVYRIEERDNGDIHMSEHYFTSTPYCNDRRTLLKKVQKLTQSKAYVVQQGVSLLRIDDRSFDIRVLVQKNRTGLWGVTNIISRLAYRGCFNTSVCEHVRYCEQILPVLYPVCGPDVLDSLHDISIKTACFMEEKGGYHLGELCVDFGVDMNGHLWVIEINGNPQRTLFKRLPNYHDVYRNPIRYARFLAAQRE